MFNIGMPRLCIVDNDISVFEAEVKVSNLEGGNCQTFYAVMHNGYTDTAIDGSLYVSKASYIRAVLADPTGEVRWKPFYDENRIEIDNDLAAAVRGCMTQYITNRSWQDVTPSIQSL